MDEPSVYILYALYPCTEWAPEGSHATEDCDCDDFVEGVFASAESAKVYIPEYLDDKHANLEWQAVDRRTDCGYRDEYARTESDLVYWIREHTVYS